MGGHLAVRRPCRVRRPTTDAIDDRRPSVWLAVGKDLGVSSITNITSRAGTSTPARRRKQPEPDSRVSAG